MYIAIGLILSLLAYFVTDEGINSVLVIMFCAVIWQKLFFRKKSSS